MFTNLAFGSSQLKKPMPNKWVMGMIIWSSIGGFLIGWVGSATFIPPHTSSFIQSILGLLVGIPNTMLPFLGIKEPPKNVPIEDVGSMNAEPTK